MKNRVKYTVKFSSINIQNAPWKSHLLKVVGDESVYVTIVIVAPPFIYVKLKIKNSLKVHNNKVFSLANFKNLDFFEK